MPSVLSFIPSICGVTIVGNPEACFLSILCPSFSSSYFACSLLLGCDDNVEATTFDGSFLLDRMSSEKPTFVAAVSPLSRFSFSLAFARVASGYQFIYFSFGMWTNL